MYSGRQFLLFLIFATLPYVSSIAQNAGNDCVDFGVICTSGSVALNPTGPGNNDFANSNNDNGCLGNEHQSAWFYFEFNNSMPPNSLIEFTIDPDQGGSQDYDFAVYGPDVDCNNLGSPIRCSYAAGSCTFCPLTGLGMGAADFSEGPGGDGFVAGIMVQPGQGFYLLVDNFSNNSTGFSLSWGGSAAPFLECNPTVNCDLMVSMLDPAPTTCAGSSGLVLSPSVTGATGNATYEWTSAGGDISWLSNPFIANPTVTVPLGASGFFTYTLTVTDDLCSESVDVVITVTDPPAPVIQHSPLMCEGENQILDAGPFYDSYVWSDGTTNQFLLINTGGTYSLTVTDASGCQGETTVNVQVVPAPEPVIFGPSSICFGGIAELYVEPIYIDYVWSNNGTQPINQVQGSGLYTVTVTSVEGCTGTAEFFIADSPGPVVSIQGPPAICNGEDAQLSAVGDFVAYEWSTNEYTPQITTNQPGYYTLTVTDANGCQATEFFILDEAPAPTPNISGDPIFCAGSSTTLSVDPFLSSYQWSTGDTTAELVVTQAGTYSVTVTNGESCAGEAQIVVSEIAAPEPTLAGVTDLCPDETTTLSVNENFASYTWNDNTTNASLNVDQAGTYAVTVTNDFGCTGTVSADLSALSEPTVNISGPDNFCTGQTATLTTSGDFASIQWSDGSTDTSQIVVNTAGTYTLSVSGQNGCTNSADFTIEENTPIPIDINGQDMFCPEGSTSLTASDDYTAYIWSTGDTTQTITVASADTFMISAVDTNGCSVSQSIIVDTYDSPVPTITGVAGICSEEETLLSVTQAFAAYQWQDNSDQNTIMASSAGTYALTVTDNNGCIGTTSYELLAYPDPTPTITGVPNFCAGNSTDLALAESYTNYAWSTGTAQDQINVDQAGTYSVIVTDTNGCSGADSVIVEEFALPDVSISGNTSFCPGNTAELSGPDNMASYLWSDGSQNQDISISTVGTVGLTVTDSNGCQNTSSLSTTEIPELSPSLVAPSTFCPGESPTLSVTENYATYLWSDGSTESELVVSTAGTYTVSVTDSQGCSGSSEVVIVQHSAPQAVITGDLSFCDGSETLLQTSESFTSYQWSDGSSSPTLNVQNGGMISLTVTDVNQCVDSTTVLVDMLPLPTPAISGELAFCPEGSTSLSTTQPYQSYAWSNNATTPAINVDQIGDYNLIVTDINGCQGEVTTTLSHFVTEEPEFSGADQFCPEGSTTLGSLQSFASYQWSNGTQGTSIDIDIPGTIGLTVSDQNGCQTENAITVTHYVVSPPVLSAPDGFCSDSQASISTSDIYNSYQWSNGGTDPVIQITDQGTYSLSVTDQNGCASESDIFVEAYDLPVPQINGSLTFCTGNSTQLSVAGNFNDFQWSDGSNTAAVVIDQAGSFGVTVTDSNGCQGETSATVNEATELSPQISGLPAICVGQSTELDAGTNFATYQWSTGDQSNSIDVSTAGTYSLTVTDTGGCSGEATFSVTVNPLPTPSLSGDTGFCAGQNAQVIVNENYTAYAWSHGPMTSAIAVDQAGVYQLTVTDSNGCQNETSVTIQEYSLPVFSIEGTDYFCSGSATQLTATANGTLTYQWSTGDSDSVIDVTQAGNYTVTATDQNGCQSSENMVISEIDIPMADAGTDGVITCDQTSVQLGGNSSSMGDYSYEWTGPNGDLLFGNQNFPSTSTAGEYTLQVVDNTFGCVSAVSTVTVADQTQAPQVVVQALDVIDCNTNSVIIDGSGSAQGDDIIYRWLDANNTPIPNANTNTLQASSPQIYVLQVINTVTGCSAADSIDLEANVAYPVADAGADLRLDCEQTQVSLDGTASQTGTTIQYEWTSIDGHPIQQGSTPAALVSEPGWYQIQVTDTDNGCSNVDSVFVDQNITPPTVALGQDQELDCVITSVSLQGQVLTVQGTPTFNWYQDNNLLPDQNQIQIQATMPGTYVLQITDSENGCMGTDQVVVRSIEERPSAIQVVSDIPTCAGDSDGWVNVSQVEGGQAPYLYSLNGGAFVAQNQFRDLAGGDYTILIQDARGCEYEEVFTLPDGNDLGVDLGTDITITYGEDASLFAEITVDPDQIASYSWSPASVLSCTDCNNPTFSPPQSVRVFLSVTDINGCIAKDDILVNVDRQRPIYAPTAISPNGDEVNDVFFLQGGSELVSIQSLLIFNRWGETIFSRFGDHAPNDPTHGWDGRHRDQVLNGGVYVWMAKVTFADGETVIVKGDVAIVK